jgi:hypothetical protein
MFVAREFVRGVFSPLGVAASALFNLIAIAEFTKDSDPWMWLFFGVLALLASSFFAYRRVITADSAVLDRWLKKGHEIREWLRFYDPEDGPARRKTMEWQVGVATELDERFPAYYDDFMKTGEVKGVGVSQLLGLLERKLSVLRAVRRGEPVPTFPGPPPFNVRFSAGPNDSEAIRLVVGAEDILRVGVKSNHDHDLDGIAANLSVPKALELEAWNEQEDAPGEGSVTEPAGDAHYWQRTDARLVGGSWSTVFAFKVKATREGGWPIELKFRVPGFESGTWHSSYTAEAEDDDGAAEEVKRPWPFP